MVAVGVLLFALLASAAAQAERIELTDASIAELNEAIDAGALSSERLVALSLARIAAYDRDGPALNAVIYPNEEALDTARALDRERETSGCR